MPATHNTVVYTAPHTPDSAVQPLPPALTAALPLLQQHAQTNSAAHIIMSATASIVQTLPASLPAATSAAVGCSSRCNSKHTHAQGHARTHTHVSVRPRQLSRRCRLAAAASSASAGCLSSCTTASTQQISHQARSAQVCTPAVCNSCSMCWTGVQHEQQECTGKNSKLTMAAAAACGGDHPGDAGTPCPVVLCSCS